MERRVRYAMSRFIFERKYWLLPLLLWTVLVGTSFLWNQRELSRHSDELALNRARFVFSMVESMRLWNARHGGVYALVKGETVPNTYLDIPHRDIPFPGGGQLTMLNPAYMTRQLAEVVRDVSKVQMHITSLKPINPDNAADPWETTALRAFDGGAPEESGFVGRGTDTQFRYMAPLVTSKACLKCHEQQGYAVGDVRGGISVSFAADALLAPQRQQLHAVAVTHALVWLLLSLLSLFALSRHRRSLVALCDAKEQQEVRVEERTAQLRAEVHEREQAEAQLRLFIESSGEGIIATDPDGICTLVNQQALTLLGYDRQAQLIGKGLHQLIHHSYEDGRPHPKDECAMEASRRGDAPVHADDDVFWRQDGSCFPVEYRSHPLHGEEGILGTVITFSDITLRKQREAQLEKLSKAVEHSPASAVITDVDGNIEYVNQRFVDVTGYQPEEVLGKNPRIWQSGRTPQKTYQRLWSTILAGHVWHGEMVNLRKSGEFFWEEASISPIKDEQGNITHFVAVKEEITARKAKEELIWRQANYDGLTELPNRDLFQTRLEQALCESEQHDSMVALLYVDLDGFKAVNDNLGHEAGDVLLREAAARIAACVRDTDTAARMGGDEFAVVLPDLKDPEGARAVAEKITETLAVAFSLEDDKITISASVGIALYPGDGETRAELLRNADAAMYRAKQDGRNTYRFVRS